MKKTILAILLLCSSARLVPHCLLLIFSPRRGLIEADLVRWASILFRKDGVTGYARLLVFLTLMTFHKEYRNLFYRRTGLAGKIFAPLCPRMSTLFIYTDRIGPGLYIQHGFSTIISADEIGSNCWINQQVTIGYTNEVDRPIIGDNVTINAGAIVIGAVKIGNNSKIGANALVVKDVPPNCTVVGVPAYIVRQNGIRVTLPLTSSSDVSLHEFCSGQAS